MNLILHFEEILFCPLSHVLVLFLSLVLTGRCGLGLLLGEITKGKFVMSL